MTDEHIEQINRLYIYFMVTHPDSDQGEYLSGDTNCILAFSEYVDTADFSDFKAALPELRRNQLARLKREIRTIIENYLLQHAKVLAIG